MGDPHIEYLVLDVLRPHNPTLPEFASFIGEFEGVSMVEISLVEMDEMTETLKVVIEGVDIKFDDLKEHIEKQSGVIHSVDQVIVRKKKD